MSQEPTRTDHIKTVVLLADGLMRRVLLVGVPTVLGILVYSVMAALLRLEELDTVKRYLHRG